MRDPLSAFRRFAGSPRVSGPGWHPPLARQHRARRRPILIAAALGLAFAGGGFLLETALDPTPRLIWNASASAPLGLYSIAPVVPLHTGDMVVARLPANVAAFAARRHYLPARVPLVKRIGAVAGDRVCGIGAAIVIDGRLAAIRLSHDRSHRPLPWWRGCMTLRDGRIFLLSPVPDAFDSRYFGPLEASAIVGRARPLWTDPKPDAGHE